MFPDSFTRCNLADYRGGDVPPCYLFARDGLGYLSGNEPCKSCPGHVFVKDQHARHLEQGGQPVGLRGFRTTIADNNLTSLMVFRRWEETALI